MEMTIDNAISAIEMGQTQLEISQQPRSIALDTAISTMRKYQQLEDFARWVAEEIIDEDMWELNHLSFAELACRKLVKLGIMQESNDEYLYEVVEDGEIIQQKIDKLKGENNG